MYDHIETDNRSVQILKAAICNDQELSHRETLEVPFHPRRYNKPYTLEDGGRRPVMMGLDVNFIHTHGQPYATTYVKSSITCFGPEQLHRDKNSE
jgi:hypothetical protein